MTCETRVAYYIRKDETYSHWEEKMATLTCPVITHGIREREKERKVETLL